jgi:putative SOS response-associated peptidase YedK
MCTRYAQHTEIQQLGLRFGVTTPLPNSRPSWNVAPTAKVPVVRVNPETRARHLDLLQWGLVPRWAQDPKSTNRPTNARSETIATSRMFREPFLKRRCLVPADAYYEWRTEEGVKQPYAFARSDGDQVVFAGLWEGWKSPEGEILRTFTIATTEPNDEVRDIHDRMPVVLEPQDWATWLGEAEGDPAALLRPAGLGVLHFWRVGRAVGNVRVDGPELLAPAA